MLMGVMEMESLPLGFRFRPTDEELISHYLRQKINGRHSEVQVIPEVDVCKWEPWDLPGLSVIKTEDPEWFFFCPRDRKYPNGHRSNRATEAGYWKATGKDRTIKSRRSNTQLVGMKKTLVFYRGRAPKGERTHWIMHEYRATEKDLDGTNPGQGAYVLCRLFRKADVSKYDEAEATGLSPVTKKSSPEDTSSDFLPEQSTEEMQTEGIKRWLTDKTDNLSGNTVAPVESWMSDIDDNSAEEAATVTYSLLGGDDIFYEPTSGQIDCKVFSPSRSQIHTELVAYMDSPFANDFGSENNGLHFQDGTSEQDVSLSELLAILQNNHDDYSFEESSRQRNLVGRTESQIEPPLAGKSCMESKGSYTAMYYDMAQAQISPWSPQDQISLVDPEYKFNDGGTSSAGSVIGPCYGLSNNFEDATSQPGIIGSGSVRSTEIKIRTRQPQNRAGSENVLWQGNAPRRIRLLMEPSSESVCHGDLGDTNSTALSEEKQEAESAASEAPPTGKETEVSSHLVVDEESKTKYNEIKETDQEVNRRIGSRKQRDGGNKQILPYKLMKSSLASRGPSSYSIYIVSIFLLFILLLVSVGTSKCPMVLSICR